MTVCKSRRHTVQPNRGAKDKHLCHPALCIAQGAQYRVPYPDEDVCSSQILRLRRVCSTQVLQPGLAGHLADFWFAFLHKDVLLPLVRLDTLKDCQAEACWGRSEQVGANWKVGSFYSPLTTNSITFKTPLGSQ